MSEDTPAPKRSSTEKEDSFYPVSSETFLTVFYVSLVGWTVWLLFRASQWDWDDRVFPYLVGIPLCLLAVSKLLKLHFQPSLPLPSTDSEEESSKVETSDGLARPRALKQRYELIMLVWVVAFPVATYYLGFVLVVPVYLCTFIWYFQRDLKLALLVSIGGSLALYLLFVVLLGVSVWEGKLDVITVPLP